MRDIIPRKQQTSRRDIAKGYDRIEAEAGGAARRIYPNTIRDNRRRDGREGELARRREIEGERQQRYNIFRALPNFDLPFGAIFSTKSPNFNEP